MYRCPHRASSIQSGRAWLASGRGGSRVVDTARDDRGSRSEGRDGRMAEVVRRRAVQLTHLHPDQELVLRLKRRIGEVVAELGPQVGAGFPRDEIGTVLLPRLLQVAVKGLLERTPMR